MSDTPNIDPVALERLQRLGGAAFAVKMMDLFVSYAGTKIAAAREAQTAGNFAGVQDAVHPIKSSAGNIGARRVQELSGQIEALARAGQGGLLPGLIRELEEAFAAAKSELEMKKQSFGTKPGEPESPTP